MSSQSQFQFESNDVRIEIEGERSFVEEAYRRVMRDVDAAREGDADPRAREPARDEVVWIIRCTPMMRRIYMAESLDLEESPVADVLDVDHLGTAYLDAESFDVLLPTLRDRDDTLWAELTEAGRRRIAGNGD